jgi:hypothetical protein
VVIVLWRVRRLNTVTFWITSIFVLLAMRLSHVWLVAEHVPDEQRSIMIAGYQVHHIVVGTAICLACAVWATRERSERHPALVSIVSALGVALVLDEAFYMLFTRVSDQDYMSAVSLLGIPVLYATVCLGTWVLGRAGTMRS